MPDVMSGAVDVPLQASTWVSIGASDYVRAKLRDAGLSLRGGWQRGFASCLSHG